MKKMMMVMALMLVAGMSQAATVLWSTGAIRVPTAPWTDGSFGAAAGATSGQYLATVSFFLDNAGVKGALIGTVTGNTDTSTAAGSSVLNGTTGGFSFTASTKYWASVVITTTPGILGAGVGEYWKQESTAAQFTEAAVGSASINFLTGSQIGGSNLLPAKWTYVPEPTSMALLAFGSALIGLRRKFRK